jgi:hypothetical protein
MQVPRRMKSSASEGDLENFSDAKRLRAGNPTTQILFEAEQFTLSCCYFQERVAQFSS